METIYFDNAATTKIKTEVLNEMMPYLSMEYGNASSLYSIGRRAKRAIENARKQVATLLNCNSNEIYFTAKDWRVCRFWLSENYRRGHFRIFAV